MFLANHPLRLALPAALIALSLAVGAPEASAQTTTIQGLHPIGIKRAQSKPYSFTGRIFDVENVGISSGTLLRRHTVQTAGHVVFEPTTGFFTYGSFSRGLYKTYSLSKDQVVAAQAFSGYQSLVTSGASFVTQSASDLGLLLVNQAPIDADWGNYLTNPTLLSSAPTFVLGYPGVNYDGRTMYFVVPSTPWVALGLTAGTALYENDEATAEPGTSGGPIYVVPDGVHQYVQASVVGTTTADSTGEFNNFLIRAIDKSASKFITAAEYTSGLIKSVQVSGPTVVTRGRTYTYTTNVLFSQPSRDGKQANVTTDRYPELKLKSSTPGTGALPLVVVKKTSNTTFSVTFTNNNRPGTTVLQVFYAGTATPLGASSLTVKIQ